MRENCTSGSMRRGEKRVMVHSANGHRTRKGGNGGAPPDLYTTALASHSTAHPEPGWAWNGGDFRRLCQEIWIRYWVRTGALEPVARHGPGRPYWFTLDSPTIDRLRSLAAQYAQRRLPGSDDHRRSGRRRRSAPSAGHVLAATVVRVGDESPRRADPTNPRASR
jgi:hypothetical protein